MCDRVHEAAVRAVDRTNRRGVASGEVFERGRVHRVDRGVGTPRPTSLADGTCLLDA